MRHFFKKLFKKDKTPLASSEGMEPPSTRRSSVKRLGTTLRRKLPRNLKQIKFDPKNIRLESVSEHSSWFQWGLIVFAVLLASALSSRIIGLWIRPTYQPIPTKKVTFVKPPTPPEDYGAIEQRNIFDVENKIPDPYDQTQLDCLSQARPSSQRISLLGTIVMNDEKLSVALIQEDGKAEKIAVKKDETFFDKFQAMKIERKKLCFQVRATQDFEYIEIPEEGGLGLSSGPVLGGGKTTDGITPLSENSFSVKQGFLDSQLKDLNTVLQTAKAVPYQDPATGKMKGFLIQTIENDSAFAQLGIRQGDVLTGVNDIILDNAGKGLEAFNRLRSANQISLKVIRGGQEQVISYDVK